MRKLAATKRNNRAIFKLLSATVVLALAPTGFVSAQTVVPSNAQPLCAVSPATFASWFVSGKPSLNGPVNPANSIQFPNQNDCNFYNWGAQMFLWLTSQASGPYGSSGFVFDSPIFYNISGSSYSQNPGGIAPLQLHLRSAEAGPHGLQLVTDKQGRMFEVVPAPQTKGGHSLVRNAAGKMIEIHRIQAQPGKKPEFFDASNKLIGLPKAPMLDTTLAQRIAPELAKVTSEERKHLVQAFEANGQVVFVDSNGDAIDPTQGQAGSLAGVLLARNQSLVYYAAMVNDVYAFFQTGTVNGTFGPYSPNNNYFFPTTQSQLNPVIAYAASKGSSLPDRIALTIELKTAWIDTVGLSALGLNPNDFITVTASVPDYNKSNPKLWIPTGQNKTVTLAMVGMHIVGSVAGHSEMAWATFEHVTNTPSSGYQYTNNQGGTSTVPQGQAGKWAFASPGATTYNVQKANYLAPPNIQGQTQGSATSNITPSDTMLLKAWGTGSNASNFIKENTEVISSDSSVLTQLIHGDVRANYIMTGVTWTIKGQTVENPAPGQTQPNNQIGTNLLANTTMETYEQGTSSQMNNGTNCFSCHTNLNQPTKQPANTNVSHIFSGLTPLYPK
ncbi:hypothetical protein EO087_03505 [Dyella sp. M7H15-1]|uniref:hypothetical protein n=1 Tax=Dyella sp. M7H15-1 TaxID=2501295 RepID=UPI001004F24C|nr:hypothetical protein [Dyella sp. M7H15-1]QAU23172.1 hypothetical protein EO087_03505 [Dyella sp. M7H15-1]